MLARFRSAFVLLSVLILISGCDFIMDMFPDGENPSTPGAEMPVDGDDGNALLGLPSSAERNTQLISREAYTLLFSYDDLIPLWVSWHLDDEDTGTGRDADFRGDPNVPQEYRLNKDDYTNCGYDRGHICPNADRSGDDGMQQESFYMTNIVPQNGDNNQGVWRELEEFIRSEYIDNGKEAYIIAGPAGVGGYDEDGELRESFTTEVDGKDVEVTVPAYVWKIAIIIDDGNDDLDRIEDRGVTVLAVCMPNADPGSNAWDDYVCTIDHIEELTGYDFLSAVDDSIEASLETRKYA